MLRPVTAINCWDRRQMANRNTCNTWVRHAYASVFLFEFNVLPCCIWLDSDTSFYRIQKLMWDCAWRKMVTPPHAESPFSTAKSYFQTVCRLREFAIQRRRCWPTNRTRITTKKKEITRKNYKIIVTCHLHSAPKIHSLPSFQSKPFFHELRLSWCFACETADGSFVLVNCIVYGNVEPSPSFIY